MRKFLRRLYSKLPIVRELRRIEASLANVNRLVVNDTIRLLDFELRSHPRYGDPRRLLCYQSQVCSQNAEDGIIHEIFRRIGTTTRTFVEVGVDGSESNTAFLLSQGWSGFWLDANDKFLRALRGRADLRGEHLRHVVAAATRENIAELFARLGVPAEFDLLSLDIDQNTYYLWQGLSGYRPRVVVVEYNAAVPADVDWKVRYDANRTWDLTQNFGASLKAFELLGREHGYSLVGCDFMGVNAFFVRDDLLAGRFVEPYTAENHHEPPRYSLVHRRAHRLGMLDRTVP
jgi:hypothetical protein